MNQPNDIKFIGFLTRVGYINLSKKYLSIVKDGIFIEDNDQYEGLYKESEVNALYCQFMSALDVIKMQNEAISALIQASKIKEGK